MNTLKKIVLTLFIANLCGAAFTQSRLSGHETVKSGKPIEVKFDDNLPDPHANFTWSSSYTNVVFTDQSANSLYILAWLWDFGDGTPPGTTPNPEHTYLAPGIYSVTLSVRSVDHGCSKTKVIKITGIDNQSPVSKNDTVETDKNTSVNVAAGMNDNTTDGPDVKYSIVTPPKNGTAGINPSDGTVTYSPMANFTGNDTVSYKLCDGAAPELCSTAQIIITVNNTVYINQPPVVNDDLSETDENVSLTVETAYNDDATDGPQVKYELLGDPAHGTASINIASGTIVYAPDSAFTGTDTMIYRVCDGGAPELCDTARVFITVNDVNYAPVANDDAVFTNENEPVSFNAAANDNMTDGPGMIFSLTGLPLHGSAVMDSVSGIIDYTPATDYYGYDTLRYSLCDKGSPEACDEAVVFIEVKYVNTAPVALNDVFATVCAQAKQLNILFNDTDNGSLEPSGVTITDGPENGTAVSNADGTISYTSDAGFKGTDSLKYQVSDNEGMLSNEANVYINVDCVTGTAIQEEGVIDIYPNPVSGSLSVYVPEGPNVTGISIFGLKGELWYHTDRYIQGSKINVEELPAGLYLLKAETEERVILKRFMVLQ